MLAFLLSAAQMNPDKLIASKGLTSRSSLAYCWLAIRFW